MHVWKELEYLRPDGPRLKCRERMKYVHTVRSELEGIKIYFPQSRPKFIDVGKDTKPLAIVAVSMGQTSIQATLQCSFIQIASDHNDLSSLLASRIRAITVNELEYLTNTLKQ